MNGIFKALAKRITAFLCVALSASSLSAQEANPVAEQQDLESPVFVASLPGNSTGVVTDAAGMSLQPLTPQAIATNSPCRVIDGRDVACRAAEQWLPAEVLRQRGRTVVQAFCEEKDECERRAAWDLNKFMQLQAKHQEDIGAASALRAYYTRISLLEQLTLTQEFLARVELEDAKQDAVQEGGLPAGTDLSSFERSRIDIRDKQLQILAKDRQLRCLLAELSNYDYGMHEICCEKLLIQEVPIDCQVLKQIALQTRRDLQGWVFIAGRVNEKSAPVFAKMLGTLIGGWGLPMPKVCGIKYLLCPPDYSQLAANMKHELNLTAETHRRWICQAVEEKCENLKLSYRRIDLANETIASWESRIVQLERLEEQGESEPAQLAEARKELLLARSEEVDRRLDARNAEIDIAEAIGGISDRCCAGDAWLKFQY